ncbi:hypothetical protein J4Q44_G00258030 [Coregonus suidteri]|uniref:Uncharacterized protein n=1 Tax=Coregonus suidteri TaxID=861788 RepID=A0AAN8QF45_9TELE
MGAPRRSGRRATMDPFAEAHSEKRTYLLLWWSRHSGRDSESLDPLQHFPVAKQMAAGLISWRCQNDKLANQRTAEVPLKWQAPERMMKHPTTDRSDVSLRYDLMKYCWMWSFKDRPVSSAIIKLLESYTYLDDTTDIYIPEGRQLELQQEGGCAPLNV